jgi:hypothetical protein
MKIKEMWHKLLHPVDSLTRRNSLESNDQALTHAVFTSQYHDIQLKADSLEVKIVKELRSRGYSPRRPDLFPDSVLVDSVPLEILIAREKACLRKLECWSALECPSSELILVYTTIGMVKRDARISMNQSAKSASFLSRNK